MTTNHETSETGDTSGCVSGGCAETSSTGTEQGTTTSDETTGPGCMVDCVPRVVFVTMMFYANNLGGPMFADSECNSDAVIGELSGTYRAWLSTDEESPKDWLDPVFDGDYVLAGDDPLVVATGTAGLLSGTLKNPINADSLGTVQTSLNKEVWTGTLTTGLASGIDCADWGMTTGFATVGHHDAVNKDWTELSDTGNCAGDRRFYCIQVSQ